MDIGPPLYYILAWETRFAWNLNFSKKKSTNSINLELLNLAKNIPVVLPSSFIKIWSKLPKGFLSYYRTNKHTDKQWLQLYV